MKDKNISFLVTFVPSINLTAAFIIDRWKIIVQKFVGCANYHSWRRCLYIKWVFAITGKITWKLQSKTPLQRHFTLEPSWVRIPPTEKVFPPKTSKRGIKESKRSIIGKRRATKKLRKNFFLIFAPKFSFHDGNDGGPASKRPRLKKVIVHTFRCRNVHEFGMLRLQVGTLHITWYVPTVLMLVVGMLILWSLKVPLMVTTYFLTFNLYIRNCSKVIIVPT